MWFLKILERRCLKLKSGENIIVEDDIHSLQVLFKVLVSVCE